MIVKCEEWIQLLTRVGVVYTLQICNCIKADVIPKIAGYKPKKIKQLIFFCEW